MVINQLASANIPHAGRSPPVLLTEEAERQGMDRSVCFILYSVAYSADSHFELVGVLQDLAQSCSPQAALQKFLFLATVGSWLIWLVWLQVWQKWKAPPMDHTRPSCTLQILLDDLGLLMSSNISQLPRKETSDALGFLDKRAPRLQEYYCRWAANVVSSEEEEDTSSPALAGVPLGLPVVASVSLLPHTPTPPTTPPPFYVLTGVSDDAPSLFEYVSSDSMTQ